MTFKAYVTAVMNKLTCFVSQGDNSRQERWAILLKIYFSEDLLQIDFSVCVPKIIEI